MYRYVLVRTGTYWYIQFCPILYRCIGFQMYVLAYTISYNIALAYDIVLDIVCYVHSIGFGAGSRIWKPDHLAHFSI